MPRPFAAPPSPPCFHERLTETPRQQPFMHLQSSSVAPDSKFKKIWEWMGAPVPIDCQQSPAGFTLHCHRSRNTSVCLCQTRVSDSVAAKLAVNNTGCSAASQQRPARGVGVPSGQPRTVRPNCIYSPRTASFLSFIRACLLPQHGTRFSPFRPHLRPAAPGTRPRHAHAVHRSPHGTARTPQRQFLPPSDPQFPSIRSLEQAYLCFPNGRPRHIEPAASLYPFPLE